MNNDFKFNLMKAVVEKNSESLYSMYIDLINRQTQLNKWFDLFLDKFNEKLENENRFSPVWNLYHHKLEEYQDLSRSINTVEFYLKSSNKNV